MNPRTDLAGYTCETSQGRYATFFWQNYCGSSSGGVRGRDLDFDGDKHNADYDEQRSFHTFGTPFNAVLVTKLNRTHVHSPGTAEVELPGDIYSSTFLKGSRSWKLPGRNTLVAINPRLHTPLAAVSWSNGLKVRSINTISSQLFGISC